MPEEKDTRKETPENTEEIENQKDDAKPKEEEIEKSGQEEAKKEFEEEGVMGRWATPEEIANGILFLATEESSYMTGADLRLDGGWTTR